jgi:hypothetical protein
LRVIEDAVLDEGSLRKLRVRVDDDRLSGMRGAGKQKQRDSDSGQHIALPCVKSVARHKRRVNDPRDHGRF